MKEDALRFMSLVTFLTPHFLKQLQISLYTNSKGILLIMLGKIILQIDFPQVTVVTFCSSDGSQLWVQSKL